MALRVLPKSESSTAAERCAREILETVPLVMRVVRGEMRRQGAFVVSVPQFRALAFVERHPGVSLAVVAEHLGVTAPTASNIVDRLVRRALLRRLPDPHERRRVLLTLTPAGGRLFARMRSKARRQVAVRLAPASAADLEKVVGALGVLDRLFREEARIIG
jgi:DNA-binding MarR family transcriptional regulator